jgi:hypothetical protein
MKYVIVIVLNLQNHIMRKTIDNYLYKTAVCCPCALTIMYFKYCYFNGKQAGEGRATGDRNSEFLPACY